MRPKPIHATPVDTEININDESQVLHWCEELGVSEDKLRNAVLSVGTKLGDVEKELANSTAEDTSATPREDVPNWQKA